jgi:predicted amidohydrolase
VAILSDAPPLRALAAAARRHGVAVACGYLERCSGRVHDAVQFIDDRGLALANYRRTHLDASDHPDAVAPGQWLNLVGFAESRLGLLIGADLDYPEPARALALAGATVLLLPAARAAGGASVTAALLQARAHENGCAIAFANLDEGEGAPPSRIVGPDGAVLARASAGLSVAELPTTTRVESVARLAARRPGLYRRLSDPHREESPVRE